MKVEITGHKEVAANLRMLDPKLVIVLKRRLNVASVALRARIQADLAAGTWGIRSRRGTSGLAGSVHENPAEEKDGAVVGGVTGAGAPFDYGAMFENGPGKPYQIIGKPVLAWKDPVTAETIFAKRVNHPGIKKANWMTGPAEAMKAAIIQMVSEGLVEEAEK